MKHGQSKYMKTV